MYFLYMEMNDDKVFELKNIEEVDHIGSNMKGLILLKSEDIQILVKIVVERNKEEFPDFGIGNKAINFEEDDYILV